MPPIRLSDDELTAILTAAKPLPADRRTEFLRAVAAVLRACPVVGPGATYRTIAAVQREFFDAPLETRDDDEHPRRRRVQSSKYG